jgi:methylated-DNA-[protein]-cysteine S-methyltransferase
MNSKPASSLSRVARVSSPLGDILVRFEPDALTGLYFDGQKHQPADLLSCPRDDDHALAVMTARWLAAYFESQPLPQSPMLKLQGTPFQTAVWRVLREIPSGQTRSYAQIAAASGSSTAVRAVGAAIGRNPVSILVPCHRVVGRDGALTGYAGGIERKAALLRLEAAPRSRSDLKAAPAFSPGSCSKH